MSGRRARLLRHGHGARLLALLVALATAVLPPTHARAAQTPAQTRAHTSRSADSAAGAPRPQATPRSPAGPPLAPGTPLGAGDEAAASAEGSIGEADPLVSNGLGSPACRGGFGAGELSAQVRGDCETSGFVAAAAPTGDFGVDVHIDTGVLGISSGGLLASVQDLCVTPLWMALVWAVHALVVMLEWCFTIDLLDSPSVQLGVARGLRQAQATFTTPWLATVLAVAAVVLAYDGLVRRQVADSLGRALLALAMTAGGLWVMLDPSGTVGALGGWANQASLGTLAVGSRGTPTQPGMALDDAMRTVFSDVVEGPWCYLEFGNVGWCRDPRRLDPRLRSAALALAAEESARIGCSASASTECASRGGSDGRALARSAALLRSARTNGAIFLALPANGAERNSINDSRSLLRAICQSEDATRCRGPSANEAEFRTNRGTWPRVGGLLLIVVGALGMLLLLGYLALRLLTAALFSLLYLLLAPLVSLAPALGEAGRSTFRKWGARLLAAVVSKLLFAFVLGALLAVLAILSELEALGWWTQWLLMSAFWWAAFIHRHDALRLASAHGERQRIDGRRRTVVRRLGASGSRRAVLERVHAAKGRLERERSKDGEARTRQRGRPREDSGSAPARRSSDASRTSFDVQAKRGVEVERIAAARTAGRDASEPRVAALDARLERIGGAAALASARGDRRRAVRLALRGERVEGEARRARAALDSARAGGGDDRPAAARGAPARGAATPGDAAREREYARFLDAQARLPAAVDAHRARTATRRDYRALAGLAGHGAHEYERLAPREQRAARLAIDRELAVRRERALTRVGVDRAGPGPGPGPSAIDADRAGRGPSPPPARRAPAVPWRAPDSSRPESRSSSESTVMDDARAVAEGRKRQLGIGRP